MITDIKVFKSVYHRNGISGLGFYAMHFSWVEGKERRCAIATVDGEDVDHVRNKVSHNPATRIITFAWDGNGVNIDETMRGDHFHEDLIKYIIGEQDKRDAELEKKFGKKKKKG